MVFNENTRVKIPVILYSDTDCGVGVIKLKY